MKLLLIFAVFCVALAQCQYFPPLFPNRPCRPGRPTRPFLPCRPTRSQSPHNREARQIILYPQADATQEIYDARVGEYPYQVSIQVDGQHTCGGSLIGKKHVLTAAHCVSSMINQKLDKSRIKVVVGSNRLTGGTRMAVDRISRHGSFRNTEESAIMLHDIAVIRLKNEIVESSTVKPIGLPAPNQEVPDNTRMILSGFGSTFTGGPVSPKLRKLYMYATNPLTCQQYWASRGIITTGHLCASLGPGYGACHGDSGGPLVLENKQTIVGIVSEGIGLGCESGVPDLYTKVSNYLDYINSELALNS